VFRSLVVGRKLYAECGYTETIAEFWLGRQLSADMVVLHTWGSATCVCIAVGMLCQQYFEAPNHQNIPSVLPTTTQVLFTMEFSIQSGTGDIIFMQTQLKSYAAL